MIKSQIWAFVKSLGRPATRAELLNFYCCITGKPRNPNYMTTCLSPDNYTRGYLMKGHHCLIKIARNQYIAS